VSELDNQAPSRAWTASSASGSIASSSTSSIGSAAPRELQRHSAAGAGLIAGLRFRPAGRPARSVTLGWLQ
jgi:hypothetical protein